jgi:hypothetical protein
MNIASPLLNVWGKPGGLVSVSAKEATKVAVADSLKEGKGVKVECSICPAFMGTDTNIFGVLVEVAMGWSESK